MTRKHVVVIGAGFSGVAAAAAIVRSKRARVTLIGRDGFGPGLAYGTKDPSHLLNVRASNMSARADKVDDFALWLHSKTGAPPTTFATRGRYGKYTQSALKQAQRAAMFSGGLKLLRGEVVSCRAGSGWWNIELASGRSIEANGVVLALGNQPVSTPSVFTDAGAKVLDPWDAKELQRIPKGDVLLLGAGLTMVDVALSLAARSRTRTIYALSRRGLTPRIHLDPPMPAPSTPLQLPQSLSQKLHEFRREVHTMAERGEPWQLAVDRLRSVTPALWRGLSPDEQSRFLRHLRVWWEVHRHRAAPEIFERAENLQRQGKLRVLAGEVVSVSPDARRRSIEIYHRQRGSMVRHRIEVSGVVNCTGSNMDITRSDDPLIRQLLSEGLARAHSTNMGFDLDEQSRLLDARGQGQGSIYAIGPITVGAFWESTAVPEIRARAAAIAALF
ncbi:MAG: FAD/NAD(P)-binding protein [Hyphomonadaceae bacterium]|nr:FAD/NAD(P)-binding protein [Hyphomonadaceae bacterium]